MSAKIWRISAGTIGATLEGDADTGPALDGDVDDEGAGVANTDGATSGRLAGATGRDTTADDSFREAIKSEI